MKFFHFISLYTSISLHKHGTSIQIQNLRMQRFCLADFVRPIWSGRFGFGHGTFRSGYISVTTFLYINTDSLAYTIFGAQGFRADLD